MTNLNTIRDLFYEMRRLGIIEVRMNKDKYDLLCGLCLEQILSVNPRDNRYIDKITHIFGIKIEVEE